MSGWVSSTGWNINLASPGPIGNVTPSTGAFTTLSASNLNVTSTITKLANNSSADVTVQIGPDTPIAARSGRLGFITASTQKNWYIANSWNVSGSLEFTQTTVAGGSTMAATPSMMLDINGNLLVGTITSPTGSQTSGNVVVNGVVSTAGYTVATLPTGMPTGSRAYVSDALTPVVLTTVAGGGAVVVPVFYDGTNWIVG